MYNNLIIYDKVINKPKLGYTFFDELINEDVDIYVIMSDTGSGKSTAVKHWLKNNNKKFISLTSRVTLAREHQRIFKNFDLDCQIYEQENLKHNFSTVCQVESINKIDRIINPNQMKDYILVLDEISSFIQHMLTSPTVKNKKQIFLNVLCKLMLCDKVICLDANITEPLKIMIDYVKNKKCLYIKNEYQNYSNTKAKELESYDAMVKKLKKLDKFIVATDSANNAKILYKELADENIKLITSEINKTNEEIVLDNHSKIIFSPKVIYGLDSVMNRNVFAYYSGNTIDSNQMYQQISRCRSIKKLYFYFTRKLKRNKKYEILDEIQKQNDNLRQWMKVINEEFEYNPIDKLIDKISNYFDNELEKDNSDRFGMFIKKLESKGFKVKLNHKYETKSKKNKKKDLLEEFHQEIFDFKTNKINEKMKLPLEIAKQNIELLSDGYKYKEHLMIVKWLESDKDDNNDLFNWLKKNMLPKELASSVCNKSKLLYMILEASNSTKEHIYLKEQINKCWFTKIQKQYKLCFPNGKINVEASKDIMSMFSYVSKHLFGKDLYLQSKTKRNNKCYVQSKLNKDVVHYHLELAKYRQNQSKKIKNSIIKDLNV